LEQDLNACFLLSGAMRLRDIIPERMVSQSDWIAFAKALETDFRARIEKRTLEDVLFEEVFLGQYIDKSSELLRKHGRRVLFTFGGRDHVISYEALKGISPQGWGLGMVVLPGINHFLAIDEQWKKWIALVVELVASFEASAVRETITGVEVSQEWRALQREGSRTTDQGVRSRHILARASLLGWDPQQVIQAEQSKAELKERIRSTVIENLRLGEMLYAYGLITFEELTRTLQIKASPVGNAKRIGGILVDDLGILRQVEVDTVASAQNRAGQEARVL
jgi:hypothetical protein